MARLSTCAMRSCTTNLWSNSLKAKGAVSSMTLREIPAGRGDDFQRPWRVEGCRGRSRRARSCRSSTPPARWSPRFTTRASATSAKGRSTRILIGHAGHPEVEGTMGQIDGPAGAGADVRQKSRRSNCRPMRRSPTSPQDDAQCRRYPRDYRSAPPGVSATSRGLDTRDICYATPEPAECGAGICCKIANLLLGGRRHQQFQFQPPARNRRGNTGSRAI